VDINFWGVTFARAPGRFYATLGTKGHTYLVEGDWAVAADGSGEPRLLVRGAWSPAVVAAPS
jgi:hypothetical protein